MAHETLPHTVGEALRDAVHWSPRATALIGDFGRLSWAALGSRVAHVAAGLHRLALAAGDAGTARGTPAGLVAGSGPRPHAVALRPAPDDVIVLLAHAVAGIPLLPLHPALTAADAERLGVAAGARRLSVAECLDARPGNVPRGAVAGRLPEAGDDLFLVPTSGSSGQPKIARLTHGAVLAAAAALTTRLPFGPRDRWILTLPLSHVGGLSVITRCLCARRAIVLVPQFHEDAVWTAMARDGGTRLSAVPAIADRLLHADGDGRLARLGLIMLGGQAAPLALRCALAEAGARAVTSYGLTESCAAASCESPADAGLLLPGCGLALSGMAIAIADTDAETDDGAAARPAGTTGRILLAGPALLAGYAGRADLAVRDRAGRFDTGDLGWIDDRGRLHVQGRRRELIVTGGEKVVPGDVEAALREHPGVRDAVVFGLPDRRWGAIVCAAVEADAGLDADPTLAVLLATLLPPWARPRRLALFDALPRLGIGKVDRRGTPALAVPRLRPLAMPPGTSTRAD